MKYYCIFCITILVVAFVLKICNHRKTKPVGIDTVANYLILLVAIVCIIRGIYVNQTCSKNCIEAGYKKDCKITTCRFPTGRGFKFWYIYDVKTENDKISFEVCASDYFHVGDNVTCYILQTQNGVVKKGIIEGNNECGEGNEWLDIGGFFIIVAAVIYGIRYDLIGFVRE